MKALRAHVLNGQIVLDEAAQLPEGVAAEVRLLEEEVGVHADERAELEADIEAGATDFERGEFEDARAFAQRLAATR